MPPMLRNMLSPLTEEEFKNTFGDHMIPVAGKESIVDIWQYVHRLAEAKVVTGQVMEEHLVERIYRSEEKAFDHILLPTENPNVFVVVVTDLLHQNIRGHFRLDMDEYYE